MTVFQELLILFGAPILVVITVFTVIFLRHPRPQSRYRPGDPYNYKPVWFVPREGAVNPAEASGTRIAIEPGTARELSSGAEVASGPKGGAHGQW